MTDLIALVERVESESKPDRDLDFDIARFEGWTQHSDESDPVYARRPGLWWAEPGEDWSVCATPPYYTSSLDAAVALVERVLPEVNCHGYEKTPKETIGYVSRNSIPAGEKAWMFEGFAPSPARAILAAVLRALQSKEATNV